MQNNGTCNFVDFNNAEHNPTTWSHIQYPEEYFAAPHPNRYPLPRLSPLAYEMPVLPTSKKSIALYKEPVLSHLLDGDWDVLFLVFAVCKSIQSDRVAIFWVMIGVLSTGRGHFPSARTLPWEHFMHEPPRYSKQLAITSLHLPLTNSDF